MRAGIAIGAAAAVVTLALVARSGRAKSSKAAIYAVHPNGPFGPAWDTRPPGLPTSARPCSAEGAAAPAIRAAAQAEGLGAAFVAFMLQLAMGESGQCFGRPANNFDARLKAGYSAAEAKRRRLVPDVNTSRPTARDLITAWGVFQMNRDAWRFVLGALGVKLAVALPFPWECTAEQEVGICVRWYARLWRNHAGRGLTPAQNGAMIRVWHWSPVAHADALDALRAGRGFAAAWAIVPADRRNTIAGHIADARIGGLA